MKRLSLPCLCLPFLLATPALCAPKTKARVARPIAAKPISQIEVSLENYTGGAQGGGGIAWTLRADGTVQRTESFSVREEMELSDTLIPTTTGTISPDDFKQLAAFIESSRVLSARMPESNGMGDVLSISIVRGGKKRGVAIPDSAPASPATAAGWAVLTLVRGITSQTEWKNPQGHAINTGLNGSFQFQTLGLSDEEAHAFAAPVFLVMDAQNKTVGQVALSNPNGLFKLVLPPATYHLEQSNPGAVPEAKRPQAKGYTWRAVPSTVSVFAGSFAHVTIELAKMPVPVQ